MTPQDLPRSAADLKALGQRLRAPGGKAVDDDNAEGLACAVLGAALSVQSLERGGTAQTLPGQPISVTQGSAVLEPFEVARALADGKLRPEDWQRQWREWGSRGWIWGRPRQRPEARR